MNWLGWIIGIRVSIIPWIIIIISLNVKHKIWKKEIREMNPYKRMLEENEMEDYVEDYVDLTGKVHENIKLIKKENICYLSGWYFIDETYDWNGPFETIEECEKIFKDYCGKYLL